MSDFGRTFSAKLGSLPVAKSIAGQVSVIGGGARSKYWGRTLSSALGQPLAYRDGGEIGPANGAARMPDRRRRRGSGGLWKSWSRTPC